MEVGGQLKEVVVATATDLSAMPGLVEHGVYLAGTGSTGVAPTFFCLSALYTAVMAVGALGQRLPAKQATTAGAPAAADQPYVPVETVTRLPQFWLIWAGVMGNAMAGITIISCAKTIMAETFGSQLPLYVDGGFAAAYVAGLSLANLGGRLFWAATSDKIGRRATYLTFGVVGLPVLCAIPSLTAMVAAEPSTVPLWAFVAGSSVVISCYGGLLGILPAYVNDKFGARNATSIFGLCMTGWASAALVGPQLMTALRSASYTRALDDLAQAVDPARFAEHFGAPLADLPALVQAKAVTIPRLLEIMPPGTLDPSYMLYNTTIYTMAGALGAAFLANALVRPIDPKHFVVPRKE